MEQRRVFKELSLELALALWLQCFCKIKFPDSTSLELKVLLAECVNLESHEKEIWRMSQHGTEKSIYRVIFRICFGIKTAMILQNTISRFNFLWSESFVSWVCYFGEPRKKTLLNVTERNREVHIQSSLSNWILLYDYNDSARYHFQIQLISN